MLNSTLEKFVTIWRFFSSTRAYMMGVYIIAVTLRASCNHLPPYKKIVKFFRQSSMRFYPSKLKPLWVLDEKKSSVGFRTISYAEPQRNDVPTVSLLLNMYTFTTQPWSILCVVKATPVFFIPWNCGSIQSTLSLET